MNSDLAIQKTVSGNSEKKVKRLEIQISKDEQYTIVVIRLNFPASPTL